MENREFERIICYFDNKNQVAIMNEDISKELYNSLKDIIHSYWID